MPRAAHSFAVFSNSAFRWFTLASMLWMMGDNIEHVISYWVIFKEFDSPALGGYAVISHWAPFLVGSVFAGSQDRARRRPNGRNREWKIRHARSRRIHCTIFPLQVTLGEDVPSPFPKKSSK